MSSITEKPKQFALRRKRLLLGSSNLRWIYRSSLERSCWVPLTGSISLFPRKNLSRVDHAPLRGVIHFAVLFLTGVYTFIWRYIGMSEMKAFLTAAVWSAIPWSCSGSGAGRVPASGGAAVGDHDGPRCWRSAECWACA